MGFADIHILFLAFLISSPMK
jgi:hypothetical protein